MSKNTSSIPNALDHIIIKGAREHNLRNISLNIPKNKLIVFTGLSGSGKSSLAFDTLYAEGQRRYVESLSSYARQFLGLMQKPDVDHIEGLSPAISIDQKTTSHNPRSTVGTITEVYDYLRLLFARIGRPHCPQCNREVAPQSIDQILTQAWNIASDHQLEFVGQPTRLQVLAPVVSGRKGEFVELFDNLRQKGFKRVRVDQDFFRLDEQFELLKNNKHTISVVIDRLVIEAQAFKNQNKGKTIRQRLTQSIEEALKLADGMVIVSLIKDEQPNFPEKPKNYTDTLFSEKRACSHCQISLPEIEPRLFSFNSPHGACPQCNGLGLLLKADPEKMIAPSLSLSEGAVIPFAKALDQDSWWARLVQTVLSQTDYDFRRTAFDDMDTKTQDLLLKGDSKIYTVTGQNRFGQLTSIKEKFVGFLEELEQRYQSTDSEHIRRDLERYMKRQVCPECQGTRLKPEALGVQVLGLDIAAVSQLTIDQAWQWTKKLKTTDKLTPKEQTIGQLIINEVASRLEFLNAVGLDYLTLSREAATLAGGEAQRIRLASQIGTGLTGVLYILDEPTIGLHQRDNQRLIATLTNLRDKGNSVVVVEHDRDVIQAADQVVDFGPGGGQQGGRVIVQGSPQEIKKCTQSLTGRYLARKKEVGALKKIKAERHLVDETDIDDLPTKESIRIAGAKAHNLKHLDVDFPLNTLTCLTGVSGSGKSTLLHHTLYLHLLKQSGKTISQAPGPIDSLMVPDIVRQVRLIDQSPIGKTPRSNPATYTKVFDYIRQIFANTKDAKLRGFGKGRFSFNVKGGRCETCQGDGQIKIEMQFLPDVYVSCDVCDGSRYNRETLEVFYQGKNIADVLALTIDEAHNLFKHHGTLATKLKTLKEVGLGYLKLGQPAPTLSGGEAQRIKLARELSTRFFDHTVYLLDEPTTGLHFADVQKLLTVLKKLVAKNNTVIVIEHNLDVVKNADWIIDLGPEGGEKGGQVVAQGPPRKLADRSKTFTEQYLKKELEAMM